MADTLVPIKIPPGLYKNGTRYQAQGRWYDANLVRFFDGTIRPIGGWRRLTNADNSDMAGLSGVTRAALAWRTDQHGVVQAFGTTTKLYAILGGVLKDITPAALPAGRLDSGETTGIDSYSYGPYGSGNYGVGAQTITIANADTWQLAQYGNYLLAVTTANKKLYLWTNDPAVLPTVPSGAPSIVSGVVATPERFIFALGAGGNGRVVQWPSQESTTDWTSTDLNTAGDFELATNGQLVCGEPGRGETLLWTDTDFHIATYIGEPFIYRFARVGENCGIIAPNAKVLVEGRAFWMGRNRFFQYDGTVRPVECEVQDYVFSDFNTTQAVKVWGMSISAFAEIWWFYPSANSNECDRYVCYNYVENHWTVGQMIRTAGFDAGAVAAPVLVDSTGIIFEHETLYPKNTALARYANGIYYADGSTPVNTEQPYLESGPFELAEGDRLMKIQRIVPDAKTLGDIGMWIYAAMDPTSDETKHGDPDGSSYSLEQPTSAMILARQVRIRIEENNQTGWRLGTVRLGVKETSRR
jgi:hypothetical protein